MSERDEAGPNRQNYIFLAREPLSDGSHVFDGAVNLDLKFVTEDDAFAFLDGLRALIKAHTNDTVSVRYNPERIAL